jgi:hypothetical protein
MSRTVSFRCSAELDEWLEREAERRMTTKSTVAQMIVANHVQSVTGDPQTEGNPVAPPEARQDPSEPVKGTPVGREIRVEFPTKEAADEFRENHSGLVLDSDDKRTKEVDVSAETPIEILPSGAPHMDVNV